MKKFKLLVFVLIFLFPFNVRGEYIFTPILEGSKAPFSGILIDAETAAKISETKAELDRLTVQVQILTKYSDDLKMNYENLLELKEQRFQDALDLKQKQLDLMTKEAERSFWEKAAFPLGIVIGSVVTILVAFAVSQTIN